MYLTPFPNLNDTLIKKLKQQRQADICELKAGLEADEGHDSVHVKRQSEGN